MVGHRLIEVNGVSLLGAAHQEAVNLLRNVDGPFTMMVCNGWNQKITQNILLGKAKSMAGGSQADSLCTVDRMDVEFFTKQGYTVEWTSGGTAVVKPPKHHQSHHLQSHDETAQNISSDGNNQNDQIYQNLPPVPPAKSAALDSSGSKKKKSSKK